MIGAGPFSRESARPVLQPSTAISRVTRSVNSRESSAPYFMPSMVRVEPEPEVPHAVAALAFDLLTLEAQGQPVHFHDVVEHAGESG